MRQRIDRLVPLAEMLARFGAHPPVAPRRLPTNDALGLVLAEPVAAPRDVPARRVAALDGWAVPAEPTFGASPYTPAPLLPGMAVAVDAATPMPETCDAVLAPEWVTMDGPAPEALQPAAPGEGVRAVGDDASVDMALLPAGHRLRPSDIALLLACGVEAVPCRRVRVAVVSATARAEASAVMLAALLAPWLGARSGAHVASNAEALGSALLAGDSDLIFTIGGTGQGSRDTTIATIARIGRVDVHGIGIDPGATAAFGSIGDRLVLALPGRIEAALAAFLLVGRPLLRHLEGASSAPRGLMGRLARKIAVAAGRTRLVFVRREGDRILPLGGSGLPLHHLAQADGFVVLPPEAEGLPAGAEMAVEPLPGLFGSDA